jgi:hypothetical protein
MKTHDSDITLTDGSTSWAKGVDSIKVTTVATPSNPDGLERTQLAWSSNFTMRGGGLTTRAGWRRLFRVHDGTSIFQGGMMYDASGANPYLLMAIGGHIFKVSPDNDFPITDLSIAGGGGNLIMSATSEQFFFVQGEEFAVIQDGLNDPASPPLFWDGTTLRRSKGITNTAVAPGTPGVNEIPAATCMAYYQGRIWYAQNRNWSAGDIVGGNSGTIAYRFRDSILNVTENPLVLGGDGFSVPTSAGAIRALAYNANLDSALGQGVLYVFTRKQVFAMQVPITRAAWIAATNNNQPTVTVAQLVNGSVNDRSVVAVNGDLYFQSLEPGIRSLNTAIRYFGQPGNTQIGVNEERALQFVDRSLLHAATGIEFNNRLIESSLPKRLPQGIVHQALLTMDFTPLSTFESTLPPIWEGMQEGLNILQMWTGDFGGLSRAFALAVSEDGGMDLWEFSTADRTDTNDHRVTAYAEFPAFNWGDNFQLKELVGGELWVDSISGEVVFTMDYRPDGDPCWYPWHKWKMCSARNTCENVKNPICYPISPQRETYNPGAGLPKPPLVCDPVSKQPTNLGFQFQTRLTIHGYARIRGLYLYAQPRMTQLFRRPVC